MFRSIGFLCLFGLFTGLFPLLAHGALLRLTMEQRKWTRWVIPVLVALYVGHIWLTNTNPMSRAQSEWFPVLFLLLIWEGMMLLCTWYMERYSF